jgi:hypothetical protein
MNIKTIKTTGRITIGIGLGNCIGQSIKGEPSNIFVLVAISIIVILYILATEAD